MSHEQVPQPPVSPAPPSSTRALLPSSPLIQYPALPSAANWPPVHPLISLAPGRKASPCTGRGRSRRPAAYPAAWRAAVSLGFSGYVCPSVGFARVRGGWLRYRACRRELVTGRRQFWILFSIVVVGGELCHVISHVACGVMGCVRWWHSGTRFIWSWSSPHSHHLPSPSPFIP